MYDNLDPPIKVQSDSFCVQWHSRTFPSMQLNSKIFPFVYNEILFVNVQ